MDSTYLPVGSYSRRTLQDFHKNTQFKSHRRNKQKSQRAFVVSALEEDAVVMIFRGMRESPPAVAAAAAGRKALQQQHPELGWSKLAQARRFLPSPPGYPTTLLTPLSPYVCGAFFFPPSR